MNITIDIEDAKAMFALAVNGTHQMTLQQAEELRPRILRVKEAINSASSQINESEDAAHAKPDGN